MQLLQPLLPASFQFLKPISEKVFSTNVLQFGWVVIDAAQVAKGRILLHVVFQPGKLLVPSTLERSIFLPKHCFGVCVQLWLLDRWWWPMSVTFFQFNSFYWKRIPWLWKSRVSWMTLHSWHCCWLRFFTSALLGNSISWWHWQKHFCRTASGTTATLWGKKLVIFLFVWDITMTMQKSKLETAKGWGTESSLTLPTQGERSGHSD